MWIGMWNVHRMKKGQNEEIVGNCSIIKTMFKMPFIK